MPLRFLSVQDVIDLQHRTIERHGGSHGVRDIGLLESAVVMPMQTFDDRYLHDGAPAMAAAYLFHIVNNHPFVDGNKRAGLAACLVFLRANNLDLDVSDNVLTTLVLQVAGGELGKAALTAWMNDHCQLYQGNR